MSISTRILCSFTLDAKRQKGKAYRQLLLFESDGANLLRHDTGGNGGTEAAVFEEQQPLTAIDQARALTQQLMEEVTKPENLNQAYRRVKANKGAAGIDGMAIDEMLDWFAEHKEEFLASLLDGSYQPQLVRGVEIPKPGGGVRQLGIPTVIDRLVQQAILQVLEPILLVPATITTNACYVQSRKAQRVCDHERENPTFSDSSYVFRLGKSAHQALEQASGYVAEGRSIVVDMDLEKFFDRVNHDILMSRLTRRIGDKRLLKIIRRFLQAGMMLHGVCIDRHEGTPQGGPLSPLLANLLLDDLDQELQRRGHKFCRYADDCNIYVRSQLAGERVLDSLTKFLEGKLRLKVNQKKSAVAPVSERKFLGYRLLSGGRLTIAPASLQRAKDRIRQITRRNRGISFERMIREVNSFTTGWVTYFRLAAGKSHLRNLDSWIRRKLRCVRLKQRKRAKSIAAFLQSLGVPWNQSWTTATCGKGWWRMSGTPSAHHGMNNHWFETQGFQSLEIRYVSLQD